LTASKRFTSRWQMVAGLTFGKNEGGVTNVPNVNDLNDPNVTMFPNGVLGNDSETAFRLSGSYQLPYAITLAGSLVANGGYPYQSTYQITRAFAATQGVALTRATQTIALSPRGDERYPSVVLVDLRVDRAFRFGSRSIRPYADFYNISNADTIVRHNIGVGATYLGPAEIIAPRIIRVGFSLNF
jgi:hypothetical protein